MGSSSSSTRSFPSSAAPVRRCSTASSTNWDRIQRALDVRAEELTKAGYAPQVVPRPGEAHTLLFELDENGRRELIESPRDAAAGADVDIRVDASAAAGFRAASRRLRRRSIRGRVLRADRTAARNAERADAARRAARARDARAETARANGRAFRHQAGGDLRRHGRGPRRRANRLACAEVKAIAAKAQRALAADMTRIGEIALPAEHALARAINKSIGHIEYHFGKLTERAIRGLARKDRERYAAVRELVATLVPDGAPQDRVTGWFGYWQQYGPHLVSQMIAEAAAGRGCV